MTGEGAAMTNPEIDTTSGHFVDIKSRPFSVEANSGLMLPDGIFDSALMYQYINFYITIISGFDLMHLSVYLKGVGDPGIHRVTDSVLISTLKAGSSHLCSMLCDFSRASPGTPTIMIIVSDPLDQIVSITKKIFVSLTTYNATSREYACEVPERVMRLQVKETSGPPVEYNDDKKRKRNPGPWIIRSFSTKLSIGFKGQFGPLAFADPWWKVIAWIIAAVAGISAVILASKGEGTASGGVQCDYDEKTGNLSNCRTPDPEPTNGPTEASLASIASALAAYAIKVGMADDVDPWRRGQAATSVGPNETTLFEKLEVSIAPEDNLEPGKPFRVQTFWLYTRTTDKGFYEASSHDSRTNDHLMGSKSLMVMRRVPATQPNVLARAVITRVDGSPYRGQQLFVTLIARPPKGQGGEFRTVLLDPDGIGQYYGTFDLESSIRSVEKHGGKGLGDWRLYIIAQDINLSPEGLPPEISAQVIGGSPIAGPAIVTLSSGVCRVVSPDALMEVY
jgi:hypothetical protein